MFYILLVAHIFEYVRELWQKSIDFLRKFNIFPSSSSSTNEFDLRNQRISTRLFIISLILSIAILIGYSSLINVTKINDVNAPDLKQYRDLYSKYRQTLTCPCKKISIKYEKFLRINYTLHQVCSSAFVTDDWIAYLAENIAGFVLDDSNEFRLFGTYICQSLKAFCESSDRTISNSLSRFYLNEYAGLSITSEQLFQSQSETLMDQFKSSTLNDFLSSLQIIRDTTQANTLFSAVITNYLLVIAEGDEYVSAYPNDWSDCACALSPKCVSPLEIVNRSDSVIFTVPGLYEGCFIVEALLQSTLECFYDQTCINILQSSLNMSSPMNISSLDSLLSSRYNKSSKIQQLVNQLMVEKWDNSHVYESYYKECEPTKCTYTYMTKNGAVYIVTTVLGLIGGLVAVLKLIIPRLVKFTPRLIKIIRRCLRLSTVETEIIIQGPNLPLFTKLKRYLLTMNLFPSVPPSTNESDLRNQRISTRLFIISLILSIAILIGYSSLINVTKINDVNAPDLKQYRDLYSKYPQTLTCPCTKVSIKYEKFLRINYTFHQVCNSAFVTDDWIEYLISATYLNLTRYLYDFRMVGPYIFQSLKAFCESTDRTISDSLSRFYLNEYVGLGVTSEQVFQSQSETLMDQFNSSTLNDFLSSLQIIRGTTQANSLFTVAGDTYVLSKDFETQRVVRSLQDHNGCSCSSAKCIDPAAIYDFPSKTPAFTVPGLYTGCFVIEGLLQSTLECFYNQTCIDILQSYINLPLRMNISSLNSLLSSRYNKSTKIQGLVNQLMVEKWNLSHVYESYYKECEPTICSYTYTTKNGAVQIVTTVFGLIGGLMTILKLLIPRLVKFAPKLIKIIRRCLRLSRVETVNNTNERTVGLWQKLINFLRKLNLFPSVPPSTNEFDLRNQRISTRLFIISLILSMIILVVCTSLVNVTKTITFNAPDLTQYSYLYSKHSQILTCPCTKIAIKYERFLRINYTLHQVCSSTFVTESYIKSFSKPDLYQTTNDPDFRDIFPYTLRALSFFCELMENIILDSLTRFYSNQYTSATVIPEHLFKSQAETSFKQFVFSRINQLLVSMQMIRDTTQVNGLMSGLYTNYYFEIISIPDIDGVEFLYPKAIELANCSCIHSVSCIEQAVIYRGKYRDNSTFVIPGLYLGCFVIEALLQSTLECFYNQTCINILESYMASSSSMNVTPLDSSLSSLYNVNSTIQELINELMVEVWNLSITYKDYYEDCRPTECSYTYANKIDAVYIATTVFGLFGGLVIVLKFIIPLLVHLIAYFICKNNRRIAPERPAVRS